MALQLRGPGRWSARSPCASACPQSWFTPIHLVDDLVFSGQTVRSAREALRIVGLDATTASAILWTYRADASVEELAAAGLTEVTCLARQSQIPD